MVKPSQTANMTAIEHFAQYVRYFVQPTEDQMKAFLSKVKAEYFQKNDILVRVGDICPKVWFVHQGMLRHYAIEGEKEGTVWFSFSGDLLTEVTSFITRKPSVHNIIAITNCELLTMEYADLQHFYDTEKVWERFGRLTTVQYLLAQMARTNSLLFQTGKQKYDQFIKEHPEALQHIPLHQIADFIGVKFETLSRIRGKRN